MATDETLAHLNHIGTRIYHENGAYEVWVGPSQDLQSGNIINAFVAGIGDTRETAINNAVQSLQLAVSRLVQLTDPRRSTPDVR